MPKRSSKPKTPRDSNLIARAIVDAATSDEPEAAPETVEPPKKNPAAVALGRLGGLKGGKARAASLSAKKRSEIAKKAAAKRWANRP